MQEHLITYLLVQVVQGVCELIHNPYVLLGFIDCDFKLLSNVAFIQILRQKIIEERYAKILFRCCA